MGLIDTVKKNREFVLYIIIYATMLLFGLVENIKGVSFPLIKAEFGVDYDSQGGLVSLTWFGYVIFCLTASLFMQRFGIKKSVLAGYLLIGIGALATLAAPSFWAAGMTLLIVNAGFGFFEVGANALAAVVFTSRAALMMNLTHFFYGVGSMAGTLMGAGIMGIVRNAIAVSGVNLYLQDFFQGVLVVTALLIDIMRRGELTWDEIIGKKR